MLSKRKFLMGLVGIAAAPFAPAVAKAAPIPGLWDEVAKLFFASHHRAVDPVLLTTDDSIVAFGRYRAAGGVVPRYPNAGVWVPGSGLWVRMPGSYPEPYSSMAEYLEALKRVGW